MKKIVITGGAGFIGSHVVRHFLNKYPEYEIYNVDSLTYAGNLENLKDLENKPNYYFRKIDINEITIIDELFQEIKPDAIIHLAAESHVDRSINNPIQFIETNVIGTANLLSAFRDLWKNEGFDNKLFYHVSTDEVYGSLTNEGGYFTEETKYDPHSPYAASKAASDHIVRAYGDTFNLPVIISNCSNNYGPNQFPEKLIPLAINNIKNNVAIPIYGKGENVRDWLWVKDHASAIDTIFHNGNKGETYNIGGHNEWSNIDLIHLLCEIMDDKLNRPKGTSKELITFVKDRAGHDLRYAIDAGKLAKELEWKPSLQFKEGLEKTVEWYLANEEWLQHITSDEYKNYYKTQYIDR